MVGGQLRCYMTSKKKQISDQQLISDLKRVSKSNNNHYVSYAYYKNTGNYDPKTLIRRFGVDGWSDVLKYVGIIHYYDHLIGAKFGLLTVVGRTETKDKYGYYLWECHCECGRFTHVSQTLLKKGAVTSCGNHKGQVMRDPKTRDKYLMSAYRDLTDKETGLRQPDFNRKKLKNNTSGYTGVYKKGNKWEAGLIVKGVNRRMSGFNTAKEAYYKGRLKLEEEYLPKNFRK